MKNYYFLLIFLFSSVLLTAQEFSTQFYFTDTLGTQDTVTVGFDPAATLEVDEIFGEIDLKEIPFGDELEVRVGQVDHQYLGCFPTNGSPIGGNIDSDQSELVIRMGKVDYNGISCENGMLSYQSFGKTTFFIKNKNLPVRINWDILIFSEDCLSRSFFTDWHPGGWFDVTCGGSPYLEDISEITELWINEPTNIQILDRSGDTLSMMHVGLADGVTSVKNLRNLPTLNTFPNPIQDQLTVQFSDAKTRPWQLFNIHGKIVKSGTFYSNKEQIQLQEITNGIYFLKIDLYKVEKLLIDHRQ